MTLRPGRSSLKDCAPGCYRQRARECARHGYRDRRRREIARRQRRPRRPATSTPTPPAALTAPPSETCPRCRAAVLHVEVLRDFAVERVRIVYLCGHDWWSPPAGGWAARSRVASDARCHACGGEKVRDGHRKCERCRMCNACGGTVKEPHTIAACPRRAAVA